MVRAKDGTSLESLVRMAIPVCRAAVRQCPRTGPGRKPEFDDWQMAVLIMVAVMNRRKSKSAQYRWIVQHGAALRAWLGLRRLPVRSTYFDRYLRIYPVFQRAVEIQGRQAISRGWADARVVAADKSLLAARGPLWHGVDRRAGRIPPGLMGVDRQSTWSCSKYHGWVQGYGYEVVVTAVPGRAVWPLLASVDTASVSEHVTFGAKIGHLPPQTRYVLTDAGYDNDEFGERIEWTAQGHPTGRRFLCPINRRNCATPADAIPTSDLTPRRRHRLRRAAFYHGTQGRRLYRRRSRSVEPFNDWFKERFELQQHVWHRGLNNNRTQILAAIFCFQLLLKLNHRRHQYNAQIQSILDGL